MNGVERAKLQIAKKQKNYANTRRDECRCTHVCTVCANSDYLTKANLFQWGC